MRWATIAIITYMLGILVFLMAADFSNAYWANSYYLWDKLKDTILIVTIYDLLRKYRTVVRWMLWYSIIRVVWEIVSMATGLSINETMGIRSLFTVLAGVFLVLLVKDLRQWQRQK